MFSAVPSFKPTNNSLCVNFAEYNVKHYPAMITQDFHRRWNLNSKCHNLLYHEGTARTYVHSFEINKSLKCRTKHLSPSVTEKHNHLQHKNDWLTNISLWTFVVQENYFRLSKTIRANQKAQTQFTWFFFVFPVPSVTTVSKTRQTIVNSPEGNKSKCQEHGKLSFQTRSRLVFSEEWWSVSGRAGVQFRQAWCAGRHVQTARLTRDSTPPGSASAARSTQTWRCSRTTTSGTKAWTCNRKK